MIIILSSICEVIKFMESIHCLRIIIIFYYKIKCDTNINNIYLTTLLKIY